jgi:hypothetical protein
MENKFSVYVLILENNPVYVGCSNNVKNRISHHKTNKKFDRYIIIKEYQSKKDALIAENALIRYLSIFVDTNIVNSLDINLLHKRLYKFTNNQNF